MIFLFESKPAYDYLTATIVQGLFHLGHMCFGYGNNWANYLTPHAGQDYDVIIQAVPHTQIPNGKPRVFLYGEDTGIAPEMDKEYRSPKANIRFVRDLRPTFNEVRATFPINFGVEDRYLCRTRVGYRLLSERKYDITFLGQIDKGRRKEIIKAIRDNFGDRNILIGDRKFNKPDQYWSKWTKTFCPHSEQYFEALSDSKIIISPMGAGPDCARHWEALASGGIPFIERMPILMAPPELVNERECVLFSNTEELVKKIYWTLKDIDRFQDLADNAYRMARDAHSTKSRATYLVSECLKAGVF